jgi:hypothetical protein
VKYFLYKKTHNKTGLKYLGYTKSKDPFKYFGSGKYWCYHIKKHGYDVVTEILLETTSKEIIKEKGLYYSNLWNVVESDEWANLKPESGDGGASARCKDTIEKIRNFQLTKDWTEKAIESRLVNCLKSAEARIGSKWTSEHRQSRMTTYINKNLETATKIIQLADQGYNKRQIALQLNVTWDKVKYSLLHRSEFEARLKENQNY